MFLKYLIQRMRMEDVEDLWGKEKGDTGKIIHSLLLSRNFKKKSKEILE